jgi:fucose 4-O-acetylase-like acetyltransferase
MWLDAILLMPKSRIHHLDVARGIGIILVVVGHLEVDPGIRARS